MNKINNLTKEKLNFLSNEVADSFLSEPGSFTVLKSKYASKLFIILIKTSY